MCLVFASNHIIGSWGEARGYQGVKNSPVPETFGEERGDIRVFLNSPAEVTLGGARGYQGVLGLTGDSDFGKEQGISISGCY